MQRSSLTERLGLGEQIQHLASRTMADRGEHIGLAIGSHNHAANIRKQMLTCQSLVYRPQVRLNGAHKGANK